MQRHQRSGVNYLQMGSSRLWLVWLLLAPALEAQTGIITTIAGRTPVNGAPVRGFGGDDGPATNAALALANLQNTCDPNRFEQTSHISIDSKGNLYLADSNNQRIRRIDTAGIITTVAGSGSTPSTNARCEPTSPPGDGDTALNA